MSQPQDEVVHLHTCPLCEACCNLEITTRGREVVSVRGDQRDPFSQGFICPKGAAIGALDRDPDRLRRPLVKRDGKHVEVSWEEAFAEIDRRLNAILAAHGRDAVGVYLGNPSAHHVSHGLFGRVFLKGLSTHNLFSASTLDQMPKQVAAGLMFGGPLAIPIPDVDHTDHLWILGGNPLVSNGSLMTAPDMRGRLRRIRDRGGRVVVFDPRRTRTADAADEHHFIRPGRDAHFLLGVIHTILKEERAAPGRLAELCNGLDQIGPLVEEFSPEAVASSCGIEAEEIRRLARDLSEAKSAAVYARIGTCTQEFGTVTSWLVDVLNVLTGNLDRKGGMLFTKAAIGATQGKGGKGRGMKIGRWKSRVREVPEACGEIPAACLAEEIETPGDGQIRALVTMCGNPVLSSPNGPRLKMALESLDFMVSVDIYRNETTRHADVILPGVSPLEKPHYPLAFTQLAVRNFARYSPPIFDLDEGQLAEWEILLKLAAIVTGQGADADIAALDDFVFEQLLQGALANPNSPIFERDADDIRRQVSRYRGPERLLDFQLRVGVYGDGFGKDPEGLNLAKLAAEGHAIDLGPLEPRLPDCLRTPSGKIELTPEPLVADLERVRERLAAEADAPALVLVGRRDLRSNNSWMHNIPDLVSGRPRCTLHVHPEDASRLGLADGETARVSSRVGSVDAPVEVTDAVMKGVVSLPHGWGHVDDDAQLDVARAHAGVCSNDLADDEQLDVHSGNAVLNGIPIQVEAL